MTPADIAWRKWRATAPEGDTQTAFHAAFAAAIEECAKVAEAECSPTKIVQPLTNAAWDECARTILAAIHALKTPQAWEVK